MIRMIASMFSVLAVLAVAGAPAMAQDETAAEMAVTESATESDDDLAKRRELAIQMHKIRPAREQVEEAIDQVARNLPPMEREKFSAVTNTAFDYESLEKLSVDTMVDLFTAAELQAMVDYFGSEEAKSVAQKLPQYQLKIQPVIAKMLDKALAEQRFGKEKTP